MRKNQARRRKKRPRNRKKSTVSPPKNSPNPPVSAIGKSAADAAIFKIERGGAIQAPRAPQTRPILEEWRALGNPAYL